MEDITQINKILKTIEQVINDKKESRIIIFPYGEGGQLVKRILNTCYGITEAFIIDNYYSKYNNSIKPIEYLEHINQYEYAVLYTCNNIKNSFLLQMLKKYISDNAIYSVFDTEIEVPKFTKCGKYSYGPLCNHYLVESVGAFSSFATYTNVVENHAIDYISTHPFIYYNPNINLPLQYGDYKTYEDYYKYDWFFPGITPRGTVKKMKRIHIGNDVWLGHGVLITNGSDIGNGVIAGAGSIITKPVPDYAVVVGVPARIIRYRYNLEQIKALNEIQWWNWSDEKIRTCYSDFFDDINIFIEKHIND